MLPGLGVAGVPAVVIVYLLGSNRADRKQNAQTRLALEKAHDAALDEVRAEKGRLRERLADLEERYEAERQARWRAEDNAARYRRMAGVSDDDGDTAGRT